MEAENNTGSFLCLFTMANALISISDVKETVQILAGLMAIICGGFTSYYYHKKTKNLSNGKGN